MQVKLDWLIIGGGIHGVHIAARLLGECGIAPDRLRILDPHYRLLAHWRNCAAATGMTHLRSPGVHHLALDPFSHLRFAGRRKKRKRRRARLFVPPLDRPALALPLNLIAPCPIIHSRAQPQPPACLRQRAPRVRV